MIPYGTMARKLLAIMKNDDEHEQNRDYKIMYMIDMQFEYQNNNVIYAPEQRFSNRGSYSQSW